MRRCDSCTACCTALAVRELDKPRYQPCAHLCAGGGCGIYAQRPGACRDYRCLWLDGHLGEDDRPDQLGVIFTTTADPDRPGEGTLPMLIEVEPGALASARVQRAISDLSSKRRVVLLDRAGRRVVGGAAPLSISIEGRRLVA